MSITLTSYANVGYFIIKYVHCNHCCYDDLLIKRHECPDGIFPLELHICSWKSTQIYLFYLFFAEILQVPNFLLESILHELSVRPLMATAQGRVLNVYFNAFGFKPSRCSNEILVLGIFHSTYSGTGSVQYWSSSGLDYVQTKDYLLVVRQL